jgi:hypothetical protein
LVLLDSICYRFHIFGKPFPDFTLKENWFDTKLARGQKQDKSVSYRTQLKSINKAFDFVGINNPTPVAKKVQEMLKCLVLLMIISVELAAGTMIVYKTTILTALPRTAIRVMQGFRKTKGCFWLGRNLVVPPPFPFKRRSSQTLTSGNKK